MRLYHYIGPAYGIDDLIERRLKIAQVQDLNDPFELLAPRFECEEQRQIWEGWRESQEKRWGALCFSKTWRNPVLWSHYADKHHGICLGFDIPDNHLMPILYKKERPKIDVQELHRRGKLTGKVANRFLRTKFSDWAYEREVRVYANLNERDPETGLFFAQFGDDLKLAEIIAGPLFDLGLARIREAVQPEDSHVVIKRSRLATKRFQIVEDK